MRVPFAKIFFRYSAAVVAALCILFGAPAQAEDYPTRPVRLIVAFTAGGTADRTARLIAAEMANTLGGAIAVENKPGANGAVAAQYVAQSEPDGYTLFFTTAGAIALSPAFHPDLNYDPIKDFAAVGEAAINSPVLVVNAGLKVMQRASLLSWRVRNPAPSRSALPDAAPCPILLCNYSRPTPAFDCSRCLTAARRKRSPTFLAGGSTAWSATFRP